jgi:S1-C subfamily serine protease
MEIVRRTGQRGVPVIRVGEEYIVGFDRPRLERAIAALPRTDVDGAQARPAFGASIADAAGVLAKQGRAATAGAYIGRVRPDTPAARAGLRPGDIIVAINGRGVLTAANAEAALRALSPGATVTLEYLRDGERRGGRTALT